jgi:hypothetical protein
MRTAVLAAAFLAGCASTPQPAPERVAVVWKRVDDVQATCQKVSGRPEIFKLRGCSTWTETDRTGERICSIYAPAPASERDTQAFATLGHELLHCFDGHWHDRWGRMNEPEREAATGAARKPAGAAAAD